MRVYRNEENDGKDTDDMNIKFNDIFKAKCSPGFNT